MNTCHEVNVTEVKVTVRTFCKRNLVMFDFGPLPPRAIVVEYNTDESLHELKIDFGEKDYQESFLNYWDPLTTGGPVEKVIISLRDYVKMIEIFSEFNGISRKKLLTLLARIFPEQVALSGLW